MNTTRTTIGSIRRAAENGRRWLRLHELIKARMLKVINMIYSRSRTERDERLEEFGRRLADVISRTHRLDPYIHFGPSSFTIKLHNPGLGPGGEIVVGVPEYGIIYGAKGEGIRCNCFPHLLYRLPGDTMVRRRQTISDSATPEKVWSMCSKAFAPFSIEAKKADDELSRFSAHLDKAA